MTEDSCQDPCSLEQGTAISSSRPRLPTDTTARLSSSTLSLSQSDTTATTSVHSADIHSFDGVSSLSAKQEPCEQAPQGYRRREIWRSAGKVLWNVTSDYFRKARGGVVHMPDKPEAGDALLTWLGAFLGIGTTGLVYDVMNGAIQGGGKEDLFVLSGSFGALSTLVYASPAASLAQPRIIFFAHGLAIMLSIVAMCVFDRGQLVWLQQALTVACVVVSMSLLRIVHPPAGALSLVFIGAYNTGFSDERLAMLVVSVVIGVQIHVAVAVLVTNVSPRRAYPAFW